MGVLSPLSLDEAVGALAEHPEALVLAGGTDLMVEVNEARHRVRGDETIVALGRVAELRSWTHDPQAGTVRVGAGVTYAELATEPLARVLPALGQAARTVGSPQIRNAATIGGNLATCSPAGDGLPVLAALEAEVELLSPAGTRTMPVGAFMTGVKRTARRPGELLTAITVPTLDGWQGYAKVGVRNAMVISIAGVCLATDRPSRSIRIALGSVAPTVMRATSAEALAIKRVDWEARTITDADAQLVADAAADAASPIDDHRSSAAYRRRAVAVLTRRQLQRAFRTGER